LPGWGGAIAGLGPGVLWLGWGKVDRAELAAGSAQPPAASKWKETGAT